MPTQEFPVTRLYVDPKANAADLGVMMAPYDMMGHRLSLAKCCYYHRPSQTVLAQAMRRFGGQELSKDAAQFVTDTCGTCSFYVKPYADSKRIYVAHVGELVSVGDLLEQHFPASSQRDFGNGRAGQEACRMAEARSRVLNAAFAYHKNPETGEGPYIKTLYAQPAVIRPDGMIALPKPNDLITTKDGDVVMQLKQCHVDDKTDQLSVRLCARDTDGAMRTCTRCADVPQAYLARLI